MDDVLKYRKQAEKMRRAASETNLPMVRAQRIAAAEKLEFLADEYERSRTFNQPALTQQYFY